MAVTIGRIGVSAANGGDGLTIPDPFEVTQSGREVSMSGYYRATTAAEATWVRDQFLGLDPSVNDAEVAVPVTFGTGASELDGYYSPMQVQATLGRGALGASGLFHVDWSATFRRGLDFKLPRIELVTTTAQVTNDYAFVATVGTMGIPNEASYYGVGTSAASTRTTDTGTCLLITPAFATVVIPYAVAPASFYKSSARLEYSVGGTYLSVVGRRDLGTFSLARVNNGLVRATASGSTVTVESYTSGAWTSSSAYRVAFSTTTTDSVTFKEATILKNAPDECTLRLYGLVNNSAGLGVTVDLNVIRGSRVLRLYCTGWSTAVTPWTCAHTTVVAQTSATYGIRRTATLNSNYTTMGATLAESRDLVNGSLTNAAGPRVSVTVFGIGCSVGSVTASTPDGSDAVGGEFYGAVATSQRVVVG